MKLVLLNIVGRLIISITLLLNRAWKILSGWFYLVLGGSALLIFDLIEFNESWYCWMYSEWRDSLNIS